MRYQGLWFCFALTLAPALVLGDDDGPVSALIAAVTEADRGAGAEAAGGTIVILDPNPDAEVDKAEAAAGAIIEIELSGSVGLSKYWLGLDCEPIEDALRAQLDLPEDAGLVIRKVVDDSPAKAAGLQVHDVIAQAKSGDAVQNITGTAQFSELIQTAEGKPITLKVRRAGKSVDVSVTPAERPGLALVRGEAQGQPRALHRRGEGENYRERAGEAGRRRWSGRFGPPAGGHGRGRGGFSFRMAGPVVVKADREKIGKLPDDMKITITKTGNEPANIAISQGDKSWTVKDNELDKLPGEVRGSLAKFLGFGLMSKLRGSFGDMMHRFGRGPGMRGPQGGSFGSRGPGFGGGHHGHGPGVAHHHGGPGSHGHRATTGSHGGSHGQHGVCPHCGASRHATAGHHGHHGHGRFAQQGRGKPQRGWMAIHAQRGPHFAQHRGCPYCGGHGRQLAHHGRGHRRMYGVGMNSNAGLTGHIRFGGNYGRGFGGSQGFAHSRGHNPHDCPICNAHRQMAQHHFGHHHDGPGGAQASGNVDGRLEALLTRLERIVGQQGAGQPGARPGAIMFGGGFNPRGRGPGMSGDGPRRDGDRPQGDRPQGDRARGPGGNPQFERPQWGGRGGPEESRETRRPPQDGPRPGPGGPPRGEGGPNDELRGQIRRLQEQQEKTAKALKDLTDALEKNQRK